MAEYDTCSYEECTANRSLTCRIICPQGVPGDGCCSYRVGSMCGQTRGPPNYVEKKEEEPTAAMGEVCSKSIPCEKGLTCCDWDNTGEGGRASTGTCGEMCAMIRPVDPEPPKCPEDPPQGIQKCDGSYDIECKYRQDLYCPTTGDSLPGRRRAGIDPDSKECVYISGYSCAGSYWAQWMANAQPGFEPVGDGSTGDVCSEELKCKEGLTCCNWDNTAGTTAVAGHCGEFCTMFVGPEEPKETEKPCSPCPPCLPCSRSLLFSSERMDCCPKLPIKCC